MQAESYMKEKVNVYIWGVGKKSSNVERALKQDECNILGFIDNNPDNWGTQYHGKPVTGSDEVLLRGKFDYMFLSMQSYDAVLYQLEAAGINRRKIIAYYNYEDLRRYSEYPFIDETLWKLDYLEYKVNKMEGTFEARIRNAKYEILDLVKNDRFWLPEIGDSREAVRRIVQERCSIIRFGDGEFEIMAGNERAPFQRCNEILSEKLKEALQAKDEHLLIAIADNYGSLEKYTDESADSIRQYMTDEVRSFHMSLLDRRQVYYDAYIFKCCHGFRDESEIPERAAWLKKVWDKRSVVLIEGDKTRTGYKNDLLDNALSVRRLICPTQNAFDKYEQIKDKAMKLSKEDMILVALGPAGKVLAYEMFKAGYQVVDIGQADMDYDEYKAGAKIRIPNPYKYVSPLPNAEILEVTDKEYLAQIIDRVE